MIYNVECNKCKKNHDIVIEFDEVGTDDRAMGVEIFYSGSNSVDCRCGNTISVSADASEYPVGDFQVYGADVSGGIIISSK